MHIPENVKVAICVATFAATLLLATIYINYIPVAVVVVGGVVLGLGLLLGSVLNIRR